MVDAAIAGFLTGLSLIIVIGAQNAYVLRQGILRSHIGAIVAVCAVSDLVLIFAGVGGIGTLVDRAGVLLEVVRWFGVVFLLWYAVGALRRARRAESLSAANAGGGAESRRRVVGRAVALTWLNPHVYLDAVLLIGSIAATHDDVTGGRWWFAVGAGAASVVWFSGLGFGATRMAPVLSRPRVWQMLELSIAVTMVVVAAKLASGA
jgi:L-lysine exporter family protein LysE/ArgO